MARFISMMDNEEIDGKYAEYPLGILFARKIITVQQHDAGIALDKYRRFSGIALKPIKATGLQDYIDRGIAADYTYDEDSAIRATARYRDGCNVMTPAARREVIDVACHYQIPVWIDSKQKNPGLWHLRDGLDALIRCFVRGEK